VTVNVFALLHRPTFSRTMHVMTSEIWLVCQIRNKNIRNIFPGVIM